MRGLKVLCLIVLIAGLLLLGLPAPAPAIPCQDGGPCPPCIKTNVVAAICLR